MKGDPKTIDAMFARERAQAPRTGTPVQLVPQGVSTAKAPKGWRSFVVVVYGERAGEIVRTSDGWAAFRTGSGELLHGIRSRAAARDWVAAHAPGAGFLPAQVAGVFAGTARNARRVSAMAAQLAAERMVRTNG